MKKAFKKAVSALTSLVIACTAAIGVIPVNAEETQAVQPVMGNDVSIEGTNSFGNLLTESFDEKMNEQQENDGCNVFSAEVTGNEATVSFETTENCTLLVAVYDEAGEQMLASGSTEVTSEETEKTVTIETDSMPQYFYLRAFLVNTVTLRPLCTSYESPNYTQEMQEFLAKTVDDFDSKKVLNLDDDSTNNFAVYGEDTKVIQSDGTVNKVTKSDVENENYVIENADSTVTSLSSGDIFALEQPDGNVLIVKVGTITVNGKTVSISGQDTSMEEVFDYVKIDESQGSENAVVDDSELEDGVTYEGIVQDSGDVQTYSADTAHDSDSAYLPAGPDIQAVEAGGEAGGSFSYKISEYKVGDDDNNVKVSANLKIEIKGSVKTYISLSYCYLELKIDVVDQLTFSVEGNVKMTSIPLGRIELSPVPGVFIRFQPSFVFKASGKIEFSTIVTTTLGFSVSSNAGYKSLSSAPECEGEVKAEATIFLGLSLEPKLVILNERIAEASITGEAGVEIKAEMPVPVPDSDHIHTCTRCIDGEIDGKVKLSASAKLLNMDKFSFEFTLADITVKICDFYYSFDHKQGGFTTCPYQSYKVSILVNDTDGNPVSGAKLTNGVSATFYGVTNENGRFEAWFGRGKWNIAASKNGITNSKLLTITDSAKSIKLILGKALSFGGGGGGSWDSDSPIDDPDISEENQRLSLGWYHSGYIDENGSLCMWGGNYNGQLGNGTTEKSLIPVKIMDNVKSVSLGEDHSAAITEDGNLYMWGYNNHGQLGNDTTEDSSTAIKIMDNVKSVSLGYLHSSAITEDGNLYMWGDNDCGQLGNDTTEDSSTPIKIMENVKSVSLGSDHSAAITNDGSLYMWGDNDCGQLGNGRYMESSTPIQIMENVKSVSLGRYHSAAITENGSLYMWGYNGWGNLGNGTHKESSTPIKIMENVKSVSLGACHSAAITEDGNLYMWGDNSWGKLGNGTTDDLSTPIKIMGNVKSVSLGTYHSAAITNDGNIYMWGGNEWGQFGNGTTKSSYVPIKIEIPSSKASVQSSSLPSQVTYLADKPAAKTKSFTELLPNETYNFYAVKSVDENPLSGDNLLYAGQYISDENGKLTVSCIPRVDCDDAKIFLKGMTKTDISGVDVTVPDILCNGEEQFANPEVTLGGTTLQFGVDYDIDKKYSAVVPGEYELVISGINDYFGEVSATYNVYCEHSFESGKCTICGSLDTEKGDVNGDGVTGVADIVALQKYLVKLKTSVAGNADVNGDGVVNAFDAVALRRIILYS